MTAGEILLELEDITTRVQKLRLRNKNAYWFCDLLHAIETLLRGTHKAVELVTKATK